MNTISDKQKNTFTMCIMCSQKNSDVWWWGSYK